MGIVINWQKQEGGVGKVSIFPESNKGISRKKDPSIKMDQKEQTRKGKNDLVPRGTRVTGSYWQPVKVSVSTQFKSAVSDFQ